MAHTANIFGDGQLAGGHSLSGAKRREGAFIAPHVVQNREVLVGRVEDYACGGVLRFSMPIWRVVRASSIRSSGMNFSRQSIVPNLQVFLLHGAMHGSLRRALKCSSEGNRHALAVAPWTMKLGVPTATAKCLGEEQFPKCMLARFCTAAISRRESMLCGMIAPSPTPLAMA